MKKLYLLLILLVFASFGFRGNSPILTKEINTLFSQKDTSIAIDSLLVNSYKDEVLKKFYKSHQYQTVWTSKDQRDCLINEIEKAEEEGLQTSDYNYTKLKNWESQYHSLADSTIIRYDVLLTQSAQKYISHLSKGKLNPRLLYKDWDLKVKKIDINSLLDKGIFKDSLKYVIENSKPNHIVYKKLKRCLKLLREYPEESIGLVNLQLKLVPNCKSNYMPIIKKRLAFWGDLKETDSIPTSLYDKKTQDAVKLFQSRHGLRADGIIARGTIEALNYSRNQRIEQVVANLERWRWFPHDFANHYLLINIPDYNLVAVKSNDTLQTQRIVVGKDTRKTPILTSKISNILLNPNWTVPPTILKEDIYPEAEKNKGIFKKKGLSIIDSKNQEVNPWTWKIEDANNYKYVQKPGRNNSLGVMKINFPNNYSVYLHDTNHRNYFGFSYRSLSSGCVRLERPLEMAAYLLNDEEQWNIKKLKDTTNINHYIKLQQQLELDIAKRNAKLLAKNPKLILKKTVFEKPELKTININIKEDIYLYQLYWTAWEDKGTLQFREDIYCVDLDLYSKLRYKNIPAIVTKPKIVDKYYSN
ncbi:L,D-transpeptidase family protein [Flavobacterium sp. SUN046]|uniref:L,D-transpeptidase family protein n=1 Tax=Flavobacterium sp. SUN046 TaxID=3002440 RepID=UPI002DBA461D|nr:L,D-transpeptidase family protein [Flavobacterium sp. SUN046]MEC4050395.1 L,D-transpeptidase family protein [Flavobacterium sp. SUN046]